MWIMIHSGSRNIGLQVAEYYDKVAKHLDAQWFSKVNPDIDLAFLPVGCKEFKDYWKEMEYCVQFALANRRLMMDRICGVLKDWQPGRLHVLLARSRQKDVKDGGGEDP